MRTSINLFTGSVRIGLHWKVLRMKYGYTCSCGWHLDRTGTRRGYADDKHNHANNATMPGPDGVPVKGCEALRKELEQSRRVPVK